MNIGELLNNIYELRAQKEVFDNESKEVGRKIAELEYKLIQLMEENEIDKTSCKSGSVSVKVSLYPQVKDIDALVVWAYTNGKAEILQKRVSPLVFKEWFEQNGEYPEGVEAYQKTTLNYRKGGN